jgi:hypothetical protein
VSTNLTIRGRPVRLSRCTGRAAASRSDHRDTHPARSRRRAKRGRALHNRASFAAARKGNRNPQGLRTLAVLSALFPADTRWYPLTSYRAVVGAPAVLAASVEGVARDASHFDRRGRNDDRHDGGGFPDRVGMARGGLGRRDETSPCDGPGMPALRLPFSM